MKKCETNNACVHGLRVLYETHASDLFPRGGALNESPNRRLSLDKPPGETKTVDQQTVTPVWASIPLSSVTLC